MRNIINPVKKQNSPPMRDSNPVVILYPGVGMFTFAKDKQTARVAAEFYINAINVMKGAEAISSYTSLPRQEAFNIEYWLLEEAKLQRMPKPKPLSGQDCPGNRQCRWNWQSHCPIICWMKEPVWSSMIMTTASGIRQVRNFRSCLERTDSLLKCWM